MKKITMAFLAILSVILSFAQSPQAFKYQTVVRDNAGEIMNNQLVSFRISILQGSATGTSMFSETHQPTTNDFGLANLEIGTGTFVSGNFTTIDWSSGSYFLKVEMDPTGGSTYQLMGASQLLSVPYALFAENTANPDDSDWTISGDDMYSTVTGNIGIGTTTPTASLEVAGHIATSNTGGSVFLGYNAGSNDDLSDNLNVFIGEGTGQSNISGYYNTASGGGSFAGNLTGNYNSALGYGSLNANSTGSWNIAIGSLALEKSISGNTNSAVGHFASAKSTSGDNNTSLGYAALHYNVTGSENTILGSQAGFGSYNSSINGCVFVGFDAGSDENTDNKLYIENSNSLSPLIYGEFDNDILAVNGMLGIGTHTPQAMLDVAGHIATSNTGGSVFLGFNAGSNDDLSDNYNVFIGDGAGQTNSTGYYNTACGGGSFSSNTTGYYNTSIGQGTLNSNTNGRYIIAIGSLALEKNSTGITNSGIGHFALGKNTSGSDNTAAGGFALHSNVLGSENTAVGSYAGYGSINNSVNGCVFIGYRAGYYENTDNKLYIENSSSSTPLIYGDFSSNILGLNGSVGIGTNMPSVKAHIVGGTDASLASGGFLMTGNTTGENIVMDENEIMARINGVANTLHLQRDGGSLSLHYGLIATSQVYINSSGWTGIGTNAPNTKLNVSAAYGEDAFRVQTNYSTKLLVTSSGAVVVGYNNSSPTFALQLQNSSTDMLGRGLAYSWNTYSDSRLKSNQRSIEYGLKEILQLQPKSYDHHSSSTNEEGEFIMVTNQKEATVGFIAQEVEQIIPEAVSVPQDDAKDLWSMDYDKLIPVLTKAIQEQQEIIEEQQVTMRELLSRIEALENK